MKPSRVAAAALLAGSGLVSVGLVALWLFVPIAGASLTIALGGGLMAAAYRVLVKP